MLITPTNKMLKEDSNEGSELGDENEKIGMANTVAIKKEPALKEIELYLGIFCNTMPPDAKQTLITMQSNEANNSLEF